MKKLLSLVLVLAVASIASAYTVGFEVDAADAKDSYVASDWITINLVTDDPGITGLAVEAIGDSSAGGVAALPLTLNATFTSLNDPGYLVNTGDVLVEYIYGNTGTTPATGILYSFEYHVPDLIHSSIIVIDDYFDGDGMGTWWEAEVSSATALYMSDEIGALEIHVTPEPMTIALLGLGGLFLRRRK